MNILGLSSFYHDAGACLLRDGDVLAAAEEERFSRVKHDARLPISAANYCLDAAGLDPDDLDYVIFYEKPLLKFERIVAGYVATYQTRVLLTLVYALILGPVALLGRLFGARLMDLAPPSAERSTWLARPRAEATLDALRRQF